MSLGMIARSIWGKVKDGCYHIFYREPMKMYRHRGLEFRHLRTIYTYASIVLLAGYGVPWGALAFWRIAIVKGCEFYAARPYLEAACMQPYFDPGSTIPWYLDLWETQASNTNHPDTFSPSIKAIMISHLTMYDAEMALLQQVSKLQDIPSNFMAADELLSSLHQVIAMASDLAPQLDDFSRKFCAQKDIMTHALRTFVEAYAMIITASNFQDLTLSSLLFFPAGYLLSFINQYTLVSWLPEPKLYRLQVKAEIRFQKRQFIDEITAALDRIEASSPTIRYAHDSTSQTQLLEAAINSIIIHQQKLRQKIDESVPIPWGWIYKPKHIVTLEEHHALSERIHRRILTIKETIGVYEAHFRRLRRHLQQLRQSFYNSPSFEFSPTGSLAIPAPLLGHVQKSHLLSCRKGSRADNNSDDSSIPDVTPHSHGFLYDFNWVDDARVSKLRSELAQLCQDRTNTEIVSDNLYTICLIYNLAAEMSDLDEDALSSIQRSWVVERREAIRRYERQTKTDRESIVNLILDTDQAYQRGTPVPEYVYRRSSTWRQ